MSALQTLPPDQRAVLQLILKQGRGYADLSGILKIDEDAVRARAIAGLESLGADSGQALSPRRRAQVTDYLLGQQTGAELDATRTYLGDSAAARRWAGDLRAQLAPVARDPLPEVPGAAANGHAPAEPVATEPAALLADAEPVVAEPAAPLADVEPDDAAQPADDDEPDLAAAAAPPADAPAPRRGRAPKPGVRPAAAPARRREAGSSSKLGGIILIAGIAILVIAAAIVFIGGGDDDEPGTQPPSQTQAQNSGQTTGGDAGAGDASQVLAQVNLNPTAAGGDAAGIGWVQRVDGRPMIAVQVQRVAANGEQDVYAAWLRAADGSVRFLGFVPTQVGRDRRFTVSALLPDNVDRFDEVLVTRESITSDRTPTRPQDVVLSGALRLRG